ncbi:bifunctional 2-polyprenyl-6-hydroxyphenol methylase/3-demethylubiquinol 3-O-methyltransferase UbiG [Acaryochloris marina]|uniref:class I SAM-dependent methyltransferase n=1 Tax=Acaryochloris marina TaxID=155978 RepID=UPI001BAEB4E0|nr:class I SAM-dependent methyltransferase [Acaryochloris marina]QUY46249.1 class I SAM-dependent methyltransferase [Acaryochloris marina S15]
MSSNAVEHYDKHLGKFYAWMVGDFTGASKSMADYFDTIGLQPTSTGKAVDLGCGHGLQTIPLAKRGFAVMGIDTCAFLLEKLKANINELPIELLQANLLSFPKHIHSEVDAVVCMGDTITHLDSIGDVKNLILSISESLSPGGSFCVSFRDYTQSELTGISRFIPVKSDDSRIHTCFLEYDSTVIHVHDLLHTREQDGWSLSASSYDKLRLAPEVLKNLAHDNKLKLVSEITIRGMNYYSFQKHIES